MFSSLYEYELKRFIESGQEVEGCKREWFTRWGLPFPYIRTREGIKEWGDLSESRTSRKRIEGLPLDVARDSKD